MDKTNLDASNSFLKLPDISHNNDMNDYSKNTQKLKINPDG